jgi:hypothetical protein
MADLRDGHKAAPVTGTGEAASAAPLCGASWGHVRHSLGCCEEGADRGQLPRPFDAARWCPPLPDAQT